MGTIIHLTYLDNKIRKPAVLLQQYKCGTIPNFIVYHDQVSSSTV